MKNIVTKLSTCSLGVKNIALAFLFTNVGYSVYSVNYYSSKIMEVLRVDIDRTLDEQRKLIETLKRNN